MLGRDDELNILDDELGLAGGGSRLVVVLGEPGMGKSALVSEWVTRTRRSGGTVLLGQCHPLGRDLPLQPVLDAVASHLAGVGSDRSGSVPRDMDDVDDVLKPLLGIASKGASHLRERGRTGGATSVGTTGENRSRLFSALSREVERAAEHGPVVLIIEDAHYADDATRSWLQFVVRRSQRVLVVVTCRPPGPELGDASRELFLGPLDRITAEALIGSEPASAFYERSGGNPLFLLELAAEPTAVLPVSVIESVGRRVGAMGASGDVVRTAAVLGPDIDIDLLAGSLHRSVSSVLDDLEVATAARLLVEHGAGFAFAHDLVREALALSVTAARRAYLHREAAAALVARTVAAPLETAFHARSGGEPDTAAQALVAGAAIATERFELEVAERLLDQALQLADTPATRHARARVRMANSDHIGATDDLAHVLGPGASADAFELAGWVAYYLRDYATARRYADEAARLAVDHDVRASAHALGGRIRHSRGELAAAREQFELAIGEGSPAVQQLASVWLGALATHEGRPAAATRSLIALDQMTTQSHPFARAHGWLARGMAAGHAGRLADAFSASHRLDDLVLSQGHQGARFGAVALNLSAWLRRSTGALETADDANRRALEVGGENNFDEPYMHARLDLADGRLRLDDVTAARELLDQVSSGLTDASTMGWHVRQRRAWLSGRIELAVGDTDAALGEAAWLVDDALARGSRRYLAFGRQLAARARAAIEPDELASLTTELDGTAALDAWWLLAELADAIDDDQLWEQADVRAQRLHGAAATVPDVDDAKLVRWTTDVLTTLGLQS